MNKKQIIKLMTFLLLAGYSCEIPPDAPGFNNPVDPEGETFIAPAVTFIQAPENGAILTSEHLELSWSGNETAIEFAWLLDDESELNWSSDSSMTLTYLDEGDHHITLYCRNVAEVVGDTSLTLNFTVNAVQGGALMFEKRRIFVQQNEVFSINVSLDDIWDFIGLSFKLPVEPAKMELQSWELLESSQNILTSDGEASIWDIIEERNDTLYVNMTRMETAPVIGGVVGSGPLLKLNFKYLSDTGYELMPLEDAVWVTTSLATRSFDSIVPLVIEIEE